MYHKYIGIDIGKSSFFVAIHGQKDVNSYSNNRQGFSEFYKAHKNSLENGLVVLETTGGYEMALIRYLQKRKHAVHRANTRKVKHFIYSYGTLAKTDRVDALGLAHYGFERHESLPLFVEYPEKALRQWVSRRTDLNKMIVQEKNRLQAPEQEGLKESYQAIIKMLSDELSKVDDNIKQLCRENPVLSEKKEVLKAIPGIGDVVAVQLLAMMPELGKVNRRQIASLGSLAPHPNESGKKVGYRRTRGGRKEIKPILYMAAMAVTQSKSELGSTYKNYVHLGKKKHAQRLATRLLKNYCASKNSSRISCCLDIEKTEAAA